MVQNNKEEVPFAHYVQAFAALDPAAAVERCQVPFDAESGWFSLQLLGKDCQIHWPDYQIRGEEGCLALTSLPAQTFLLRYLLEGKAVASGGTWKTFREMPWGEMYIQPYTGRCLTRAAFTFGTRTKQFAAACQAMGAKRLPHGDCAFELPVLDNYAMQIIVWEGDDEFPPSAQLLYSDNFASGFAAEDRVVAGDLLITAIKAKMNEEMRA